MGTPKCVWPGSKSISKFNSTVNNKRKKENDTHQEFLCPQGSSWGFNVLYVCNLQYVSLIIMNSSSIYAPYGLNIYRTVAYRSRSLFFFYFDFLNVHLNHIHIICIHIIDLQAWRVSRWTFKLIL